MYNIVLSVKCSICSPLQECSLQVLSSDEVPVHEPILQDRCRYCRPPPQGSSHLVQSLQSDHPSLLTESIWWESPHQPSWVQTRSSWCILPVCSGLSLSPVATHSVLKRLWMVESPDVFSFNHGVQGVSSRNSGQGQFPQVSVFSSQPGHGDPPFFGTGLVHERCLRLIPVPHEAEHLPQDPHSLHPPSTGKALYAVECKEY